jgi:hypothetical protein
MKRRLAFAALVLSVGLSSCQCSEKPDIGPVEDDDSQAAAYDAFDQRPAALGPASTADAPARVRVSRA